MILNIFGTSKTGKTTTVVEIIKILKEANLRVATIKHTKGNFTIDTPGKDSFKHQEAGAQMTVLATAVETDFIVKDVLDLEAILDILHLLREVDVVVVEGYKELKTKRPILIKRFKPDEVDLENILGEVREYIRIDKALHELPGLDCGKCGFQNCTGFAKEIVEGRKETRDCQAQGDYDIRIFVNGEQLALNRFSSLMTKNTIMGMINSLKHTGKVKDIKVEIKNVD